MAENRAKASAVEGRAQDSMSLVSAEPQADRKFVTALARGLEVLRVFRPGEGPLGNQEIAQRARLPKPTVTRLTYTLTKLGYLTALDRIGKYQLGPAVLALGYAGLASMEFTQIARPDMQDLSSYSEHASVAIGARDRHKMLYIACCRPSNVVTLQLDVGNRIPIGPTAMGRAYMAALADDERSALLEELGEVGVPDIDQIAEGAERAREE